MTADPPAALADPAPAVHEHEWHLVSVENEPGGLVMEYVCGSCRGVLFQ